MASTSLKTGAKKPITARKQSYKPEYSVKWEFIQPSRKGENFVRCTVCGSDFSISHSGSYDIMHHIKTTKHQSMADTKPSRSIKEFLPSRPTSSGEYNVIRAETLWTEYVVDHNMPFASSDDFTDVVKKMFPDSKIAY